MDDLTTSRRINTSDQADGLRRMFAGTRPRIVPLVANAHVDCASVLLERLASAFAELGARILLVDAADSSPHAHEMAAIDLSACIEPLGGPVHYLAARGLPLRHVNARGSSEAWLAALETAAPWADVIVLHASARDLVRLVGGRELRPVLTASLADESLTDAYASMKLLSQRSRLLSFDVLIGMQGRPRHAERLAERLAETGDAFLGSTIRGFAAVDCGQGLEAPLAPALLRMATDQLLIPDAAVPVLLTAATPMRLETGASALSAYLY